MRPAGPTGTPTTDERERDGGRGRRERARELRAFGVVATVGLWLCASMPVFSQEAYYWTYAQHPALSYFDHPPMVAWWIRIGTALFGDGALGLRFGTWLLACGTTLLGLAWLRELGIDAGGRRAWIWLGLGVPILAVGHWLATPDAPLLLFWTLAMLALWRARGRRLRWWLLAGAAAGAALASKYTGAFVVVSGVLLLFLDRDLRRQLAGPGPYVALLAAAVLFAPVIVWNAQHDFESFRFQSSARYAKARFGLHWLWECLGGQVLVLNPVLAALTPMLLLWLVRRCRGGDARARWLLAFAAPLPLFLLATALCIQVKINWFAPAAVPMALAGVLWWTQSDFRQVHPRLARVACVAVIAVSALLPLSPIVRLLPAHGDTSWSGWEEIAARAESWKDRIDGEDGIDGNTFFFAASYRDTAQLYRARELMARHQGRAGAREPTLSKNVFGRRAQQFDHWVSPRSRIGQDAILVLRRGDDRRDPLARVSPHFRSLEAVEHVRVERLGLCVQEADLYVCRGYRGPE